MKCSEGRHYHQFLQEGGVQFGRQFPDILMTFGGPGGPWATFGGSPGPGPVFDEFWLDFGRIRERPVGAWEHQVDPIGRHCGAWASILIVF